MLNNSSDLILLDRMLPGKDGITLTRKLARLVSQCRFFC